MAATNIGHSHSLQNDSDLDLSDIESIISNETDDGVEHPPERVLAEHQPRLGHYRTWYLIKWQDCPVLRSSWEGHSLFNTYPGILLDWKVEKKKQEEGKSKPLDIVAFNKAVQDLEGLERQRRTLRRLKRKVIRILSIVDK